MMVGCGGESDPTSHVAMMHISEYERELALLLKDSNGLLSAPMQYGSDPNSAIMWDADRILGCHCNEGNEGFTCNLRSCPTLVPIPFWAEIIHYTLVPIPGFATMIRVTANV
jgi:hypothetical protein